MARNNGGPECPKVDRLEELIDLVTSCKSGIGQESPITLDDATLQEIVEALDWTHTMLSNRKVYQKKQQITKKIYFKMAKELLSLDEQAEIKAQAAKNLAEAVANE